MWNDPTTSHRRCLSYALSFAYLTFPPFRPGSSRHYPLCQAEHVDELTRLLQSVFSRISFNFFSPSAHKSHHKVLQLKKLIPCRRIMVALLSSKPHASCLLRES